MNDQPSPPSPRVRSPLRLGLLLIAIIAAWMIISPLGGRLLQPGSDAPAWKLPRADDSGGTLSLADLKGQVVVLDFWSTTCPPCLRQIEDLKVLWRRTKPRGVAVVGVSTGGESPSQIAAFGRDRAIDYPLAIDSGKVSAAYGVNTLPTLYVIDTHGRIVVGHSGYWPFDEIAAVVGQTLAAQSSIQNSQPQ